MAWPPNWKASSPVPGVKMKLLKENFPQEQRRFSNGNLAVRQGKSAWLNIHTQECLELKKSAENPESRIYKVLLPPFEENCSSGRRAASRNYVGRYGAFSCGVSSVSSGDGFDVPGLCWRSRFTDYQYSMRHNSWPSAACRWHCCGNEPQREACQLS